MSKGSIITNGLKLYLDAGNTSSYPRTGTLWSDLSGNSYNATLINGSVYNSDGAGNILFDGINDYAVMGNILNDVLSGTNNKFSWGVWCNKSTNTTTGSLIAKNADGGMGVNERFTSLNFRSNKFDFVMLADPNASTWYRVVQTTETFNVNQWYYVFGTYDGSINTNNGLDRFKIYINGVSKSLIIASQGGSLGNTILGSIAKLSIGMSVASNNNINYPFIGKIANAKIYNKVLSELEVLQNYNALKSRFGL